MTNVTTKDRNERGRCDAAVLAAVVGLLVVLGIQLIDRLPGDWLGWLLQFWGMA